MANKTAMQTLIEWGDKMMLENPMKTLSFADAIDKAEELLKLEKQQIIEAWLDGYADAYNWPTKKTSEEYYNETYGNNSTL